MAFFDVEGGSSSSHGQTDTETAVFSAITVPTSSHGHTEQAAPGARVDSEFSGINFVPSLCNGTDKREKNPNISNGTIFFCFHKKWHNINQFEKDKNKCIFSKGLKYQGNCI